MIARMMKNNHVQRIFLLLGVPLVTTLVLLIGTVALRVPGISPFSFAHAMTTCVSTQGTNPILCNQQNPVAQGCTQDARTLEEVSAFDTKNTLIGKVQLRHSPACKTFWVRTIAIASQVQAVEATISLNDGQVQVHQNNDIQPDQRLVVITDMIQPTKNPRIVAGVFHLDGQTQPIIIPLQDPLSEQVKF
jgi:hypothetical protein